MARKQAPEFEEHIIDAPGARIAAPIAWRKAEYAWIATEILQRNPLTGTTKFEYLLTREWTGYLYLLQNNYLFEPPKNIDFKNQIHYYDRFIWTAETAIQNYINELTTPDADANEIIDETALSLLYAGDLFVGIANTIDIPIIGDIINLITGALSGIASDNLYYFPRPNRPDECIISCPNYTGTQIKLKFLWIPYSPISAGAGLAEVDIEDEILPPELPAPTQPLEEETPPGKCPEIPPPEPDNPYDGDEPNPPNYAGTGNAQLAWTRISQSGQYASITNTINSVAFPIQGYFIEKNNPVTVAGKIYYRQLIWKLLDANGVEKSATITTSINIGYDVVDSVVLRAS